MQRVANELMLIHHQEFHEACIPLAKMPMLMHFFKFDSRSHTAKGRCDKQALRSGGIGSGWQRIVRGKGDHSGEMNGCEKADLTRRPRVFSLASY